MNTNQTDDALLQAKHSSDLVYLKMTDGDRFAVKVEDWDDRGIVARLGTRKDKARFFPWSAVLYVEWERGGVSEVTEDASARPGASGEATGVSQEVPDRFAEDWRAGKVEFTNAIDNYTAQGAYRGPASVEDFGEHAGGYGGPPVRDGNRVDPVKLFMAANYPKRHG